MPSIEIKAPRLESGRNRSIDELKGLAIILIILYHAGGVLVWQNFFHGDIGVDLFVILSGLGLGLSSRSESGGQFLKRRLIRIMPAYWIVLTAFLAANTYILQIPYSPFNIVTHYVGIHACFGDAIGFSVDDSFWFITLILGLYLLYVPMRGVLRRPDLLVLFGGILSAAVAYAYWSTGQSGCFGHIGLRLPGFFAGLLAGRLLREGRLEVPLSPAFAAGLFILVYVPYTHGIVFYTEVTAFALAMGYLFLWKSAAPANLRARVSGFLAFFGTYSLEIFLIHQPLLREYNYYLQARLFHDTHPSSGSLIAGMVVGLGATLFLSYELHSVLARIFGPSQPPPPAAVAA
ncbi:MAG TPA: acyltransferase [Opitutaceae bacterium]|jgi:peptidoglycan/LPS O-acetylase OafA/YrhL